ncbi:MAG: hypothetical protein APR63_06950 [Desulfuromonas sp. SDB]|nr:MAG: hypothetical protein APR63_06950 [Desulfuromonas sp. SDB]
MEKQLNFEEVMDQLNQIVEKLEDPDLKLDQTIKFYEQGMKLLRIAEKFLTEAEVKINKITEEGQLEKFK